MGGFANDANGNDVTYCTNWDFRGVNPPLAQMLTDAQFMMGSTAAPHCRVGTITSSDGSITFTYSNPTGSTALLDIKAASSGTDLHTAKWIVNPTAGAGGNQTTIAAAITAASAGDTIFIMPGTTGVYTENLTLKDGVDLVAFVGDGDNPNVTILGTATYSGTGNVTISGINFKTNGAAAVAYTSASGSPNLTFIHCNFISNWNGTAISVATNSATANIIFKDCTGDCIAGTSTPFQHTSGSAGIIKFENCDFSNTVGSTTPITESSSATFIIRNSYFKSQLSFSSICSLSMANCLVDTSALNISSFTCSASGGVLATSSYFSSGSASAISITNNTTSIVSCAINSSNTNAISGGGTIQYGGLVFVGSSSNISTTTQVPLVASNDAMTIVTPGAYPYTTKPQDGLIKVDTSAARTIIPLASPTLGQRHKIKDTVGSCATNNITVTPSGKNIDGVASFVMNINYGELDIVYTGTEWSVV